ncbi:hypothetical protein RCH12_003703 [Cryobacterium sp. MP_3.1]|uniref:hypothetical protein n=1 Tax=Cryobacterium sp. MP_3.1 TaxID=3071711 RepID=UPI00228D2769|nr:hypothetical protein [Cryobacterium sp.]MEC5186219.1 hypothetical protein [Cryobacterium sp. MP_3.1]
MKIITKLAAIGSIAIVAALGVTMPASAAPVGSCSSGPSWDNSIPAGVASCNGSYWRVNVSCVNNSTNYGAWGGARTAVTVHNGCKNNWFTSVVTQ